MFVQPRAMFVTFSCLTLWLGGLLPVFVWAEPYEVEADELGYDKTSAEFTAQGSVSIVTDSKTLASDKLIYKQSEDRIEALGSVKFENAEGIMLEADAVNLTQNLEAGSISALRLSVPDLGEILQASSATRVGDIYTMEDITYSPCPTCAEEPEAKKPWRIQARKIAFDQSKETITYHDATLQVLNTPVFYLPWFEHYVGDEPKSGWLSPKFGQSTLHGLETTQSWYAYVPGNNSDYTLRARAMSERGIMGMVERRQDARQTYSEIRTSFLEDDVRGSFRGHAKGAIEHVLRPGRRVGFNLDVASDDSYLQDFFGVTESYLPSTLYFEDGSPNHYFGFSATRFQDLIETRDPAETAQIFPRFQFQRHWQLDNGLALLGGGHISLQTDALMLHRAEGNRMRRAVNAINYEKTVPTFNLPLVSAGRLTLNTSLRSDIYHVDAEQEESTFTGRFLPSAALKWDMPLINADGSHVVTPMLMGIWSPAGGNPTEIPNEDSVFYELDIHNLFSQNRFAGFDRVESGLRLIYGLDQKWRQDGRTAWRFFFGQSWRMDDDSILPATGGTGTNLSDWVGLLEANPRDWFTLRSIFRLDNADWNARRADTSVTLGKQNGAYIQVSHALLADASEEIFARGALPLNDTWTLHARTRRDLENDGLQLEGEVGLTYFNECFNIDFSVKRQGFSSGELQPRTDYLVNVNLLTLGADE